MSFVFLTTNFGYRVCYVPFNGIQWCAGEITETQTAVINIINLRIFISKLDVSYASQHTFSKVTAVCVVFLIKLRWPGNAFMTLGKSLDILGNFFSP